MRPLLVALAALGALGPGVAVGAPAQDIDSRDLQVVQERMVGRWTAGGGDLLEDVRRSVRTLREDGSWSDVDYEDRERSAWGTVTHLYRVRSMATLWRTQGLESEAVPGLLEASLAGQGTKPSASGGTRVTLRLPGGELAGSTVVRTFQRKRQDP